MSSWSPLWKRLSFEMMRSCVKVEPDRAFVAQELEDDERASGTGERRERQGSQQMKQLPRHLLSMTGEHGFGYFP